MKIDLNGRLVPVDEAKVSVYDHGFMYGIGLFETLRTYNGVPFLLAEHMERLLAGCHEIGIAYQPSLNDLKERITVLLAANQLDDAYIRISLSAGISELGLPEQAYKKPTEIIYVKRLPEALQQGKVLRKLRTVRNRPEGTIRHKSFHFMNNLLAKRELQQHGAGAAEGLFLQADGYLAEGIVSNLFFMKQGILYTPALETGILPGITRKIVLKLAEEALIPYEEGLYRWNDLLQADEVFLTNSIQEIVPVIRLVDEDGKVCSELPIGEVTKQLLKLYREKAGEN